MKRHFIYAMVGTLGLAVTLRFSAAYAQSLLKPELCPTTCNLEHHGTMYAPADTVWFQYDNGIANTGFGYLEVRAGDVLDSLADTVEAVQRIQIAGGGYLDTLVGLFIYDHHPDHDHYHFNNFVQYRLRRVADDSVVLALDKSGFCLTDGGSKAIDSCCADSILEDGPPSAFYNTNSCLYEPPALFMGISAGYVDVYAFPLEGQAMNVADVPNGAYWLESIANASADIIDIDFSPDTTRIKVNIISNLDSYEPNESSSSVAAKPIGGIYSANLAGCGNILIENLSVHEKYFVSREWTSDEDWFRFLLTDAATDAHSLRISFDDELGDLELELRDSSGTLLDSSFSDTGDEEVISLDSCGPGWYYVRVYGDGKTNFGTQQNPLWQRYVNWNYELDITAPEGICGDVNGNGLVNAGDILHFNASCFYDTFICENLADVDSSCSISCYSDLTYLYEYVFESGPDPDCTCE